MLNLSVFLGAYALLGLIAALTLESGLLTVILVLTFGLALPITLAPGAFLYATALLPSALLGGLGAPWPIVVALGAVACLALGLGAPMLAEDVARADIAPLLASDVERPAPQRPRLVELIRSPARGSTPLLTAACDAVCQKLVLNGEADRVKVSGLNRKGSVEATVVYRFERRPACPNAFADAEMALPATKAAIALGSCIVPEVGAGLPGGAVRVSLLVTGPDEQPLFRSSWRFAHEPKRVRRLDIVDATASAPRLVLRRTEAETQVLEKPLFVVPQSSGDIRVHMDWWRRDLKERAFDLEDELRRHLGYRLDDVNAAPEGRGALVRALLDRPGAEALGPDMIALVSDAMRELAGKSVLSETEIELIGRVVADPRVEDAIDAARALDRHRDVARRFLPEIVDRLARPTPESRGHGNNQFGWVLTRLLIEDLRPYAERLLAIAESDAAWTTAPLLRIAGRLGPDPVALLSSRLESKSHPVREAAIIGICAADPVWAPRLLPVLEAHVGRIRYQSGSPPDELVTALLALRRFGRSEAAEAVVARFGPEQVTALRRALERRARGVDWEACART